MAGRAGRRGNEDGDGPQNGTQMFAEELKARREAAGLTQEQAGKLMGYSASVIAKLETCRTVASPEHAAMADAAFKTPGTFRRLRKSMINGVYEPWFQAYLEIEERAAVLRSWQPLWSMGCCRPGTTRGRSCGGPGRPTVTRGLSSMSPPGWPGRRSCGERTPSRRSCR